MINICGAVTKSWLTCCLLLSSCLVPCCVCFVYSIQTRSTSGSNRSMSVYHQTKHVFPSDPRVTNAQVLSVERRRSEWFTFAFAYDYIDVQV